MFVPNTRVNVLRGTYQTADDDTADSVNPVAVDVPASLVQVAQTVTSPETGRSYDIESVTGYVRRSTDVLKGDRLLDKKTGIVYTVDAVSGSSVFVPADKKLKLREFEA